MLMSNLRKLLEELVHDRQAKICNDQTVTAKRFFNRIIS
jgi:hypothetical protein